jgi:hypothetical protein
LPTQSSKIEFIVYAQGPQPSSIEFTNVTAAAGIKFAHFKGNKGISINREEFGPGVCVADSMATAGRIFIVNGRDLYNRGISVRMPIITTVHPTDLTEKGA